jgi:hypothetical protein
MTLRLNTESFESAAHNMPHSKRGHRTTRLLKRHEDIAGRAARPHLQIAQDRLPDFVLQRITLISSALGTFDAERLFAPINIDQQQTRNLAAPQRIDGAQQQNSVSAQRTSCRPLALMPEQPADIAPLRTPRCGVVFRYSGFSDSSRKARPTPAVPLRMQKEGPQRLSVASNRRKTPPFSTFCFQEPVQLVQGDTRAPRLPRQATKGITSLACRIREWFRSRLRWSGAGTRGTL